MQFATLYDPANQAYFVRIEGEIATPIGRAYDPIGADPLRVMLSNGGEPASAPSIADDFPMKDARYLPAVTAPEKIIAIGLNYKSHAEEVGQPLPKDASMSWCKYTSSLLGHNEPIRYRRADSEEVDYEVELTVVMGRRCRDVSESAALDYVFGYTVCNDVTARNRVFTEKGWIKQLCTPKSFDTFTPLGPTIVPSSDIPDPQNLGLRTRLNGAVMQDSNTDEMKFSCAELIAYHSRFFTLEPGDLIPTSTPGGVGFVRNPPIFLLDGDVVEVEVDGVGTLRNHIEVYE